MKHKLEDLARNENDNQLKMEMEEIKQSQSEMINTLKIQHENTINDITNKCQVIEEQFKLSQSKCEHFEQQIESDKQAMILLSNQHQQVCNMHF